MASELQVLDYNFPGDEAKIAATRYGVNWPVVYLIHSDSEIYVGETTSAYVRYQQHANPKGNNYKERKKLNQIKIVFDDSFNKSAILDIEQNLIHLIDADSSIQKEKNHGRWLKLQNKNAGQSYQHNYYDRARYQVKVEEIWDILLEKGLASNSYSDITNSDLFKYSPYTSLTSEQEKVCRDVIRDALRCLISGKKGAAILHGVAGTGKSIVLINMIMTLLKSLYVKYDYDPEDDSEEELDERFALHCELERFYEDWKSKTGYKDLKIGFIVPMSSIRSTFKAVFKMSGKTTKGMTASMVIGPNEVVTGPNKREYDIVFVDEAHRLKRRVAMSGTEMYAFDNCCKELGLNPSTANHLDFILAKTKYQVLVYDAKQSIKPTDIPTDDFMNRLKTRNVILKELRSQMRCLGGGDFLQYIDDILEVKNPEKRSFDGFEFGLFKDPNALISFVVKKNSKEGLCRTLAGYSWEWISGGKGKSVNDLKKAGVKPDIQFGEKCYYWNVNDKQWILNSSPEEIGCVHTSQGYDLNRVGVIFGKEIDYDENNKCITINRNEFKDKKVKQQTDDDTLKKFIINAYKVMLVRGIKGCYVYACNDRLRNYLSGFFPVL